MPICELAQLEHQLENSTLYMNMLCATREKGNNFIKSKQNEQK